MEHRIIISGGGTGGHIFPAIAIACELRRQFPEAEILFVGAEGRMEMEKVPQAGFEIVGLPIKGLQRRLSGENFKLPFKLIGSVIKARRIIKSFKPTAAVGVGGYASGPMLLACRLGGVPYLIQEQNSYAGLTNKWLAGGADKICTAWPGMDKYFPAYKIVLTGNPVRAQIKNQMLTQAEAQQKFGLQPGKSTLLITGGSLGARTLNQAAYSGINMLLNAGIQLIWQTGKQWGAFNSVPQQGGVWTSAFIDRMEDAYTAADVVIGRSGALTLSELAVLGKAAILVPSPNVAEDHQTKNAMSLVSREAALLVTDAEAAQKLIPAAKELILNTDMRAKMCRNIAKLALPNADQLIVGELLALSRG